MVYFRACVFLMLSAVLIAGCGSVSPKTTIEGVAYGVQPYQDLPVPRGFTFDDSEKSWAYRLYENSALNMRSGVFRYMGDRDIGQLKNWYINQMAVHDWVKIADTDNREGRRASLVFQKDSEEAIITFVRELDSRRLKPYTIITISIGVVAAAK